ncbi:hypothetical protein NDU88_003907 [Pleurodeles waltl]|uniref:Uncharacterized protein n=1 Tax=Pleurodeles waltl TaxID=8319 RepID=A0AAV7WQE6_PLEWA|nr:hypothetical protein NDU88_003907 [Pleurodeles waltl]
MLKQGNTMEQYITPMVLPQRTARLEVSGDEACTLLNAGEPSRVELLTANQGSWVAQEGDDFPCYFKNGMKLKLKIQQPVAAHRICWSRPLQWGRGCPACSCEGPEVRAGCWGRLRRRCGQAAYSGLPEQNLGVAARPGEGPEASTGCRATGGDIAAQWRSGE